MSIAFRRTIALMSVTFLLLMQAAPALAVCLCDLPEGESCCTKPASSATEETPVVESVGSCCAEEPAVVEEAAPAPCSEMRSADEGQVSLSPPACKSDLVSAEVPSAVLPIEFSPERTQDSSALATLPVNAPAVVAGLGATRGQLRGPPDGAGPPGTRRNAPLLL